MPFLNFNPWVILGIILALFIFGGTCYEAGHKNGVNSQKVVDQQAVDQVNTKIEENKKQANAILRKADADIIALQQQRDAAKTKLQQEKQQNDQTNARLRDVLYVNGLRFQSAESGRSGPGGADQLPAGADPASHPTAAGTCQLSQKAAGDLIGIVSDCSILASDYKVIYDWAHALK